MSRLLPSVSLVTFVLVLSFGKSAPATVTVRFDPPDVTVDLGDIFTLDIVADIPDPVVAWGLDLTIDDGLVLSTWPDNVLCSPPVIGPEWADPGFTPDGDLLGGIGFPNSVSGTSILLATVTFSADALGDTDLFLGDDNPYPHESPPNDLTEGFGLDPSGFAEVSYMTGHVAVVPEPSTILLLSAASMLFLRRRRHDA